MLIEHKNVRILTDPGSYSTTQNEAKDVDIVLITHEHGDHFHLESLKIVLVNNPDAQIVTNSAVGKLLDAEHIAHSIVGDAQSITLKEILIEGFGTKHAEVYKQFGDVENTGYFVDNIFFYPGDALHDPKRPIDILALPVAGPWMRIREAIEYALALKPRGILFLGTSEGIGDFNELFSVLDRKAKLYQRKDGLQSLPHVPMSRVVPPQSALNATLTGASSKTAAPARLPLRELLPARGGTICP